MSLCHDVIEDTYYFICKEMRAVTSWAASRNTRGSEITSRWRRTTLLPAQRNNVTMLQSYNVTNFNEEVTS